MTDRTVSYYQHPVSPAFARHMIEEIGLSDRDQTIVRNLRQCSGDTTYYADLIGMPLKRYNEAAANIHRREMAELFRLAQIGYEAELRSRAQ